MLTVRRISCVEPNAYRIGDIIHFNMKTGEEVKAIAVKVIGQKTIFLFVDCLTEPGRMNDRDTNTGGYAASKMRQTVLALVNQMPDEIRAKMVPVDDDGEDLMRLPSEKEIFGVNKYGVVEPEEVTQWEPMKLRRNRIAMRGLNGDLYWYWLKNKTARDSIAFALVSVRGHADHAGASYVCGVRPAFGISSDL